MKRILILIIVIVVGSISSKIRDSVPRDMAIQSASDITIVYRKSDLLMEGENYSYYLVSGDGSNEQWIGNYSGVPVWSPDGKKLAVNCRDNVNEICILDMTTLINPIEFPPEVWPINPRPKVISSIDLPSDCASLLSQSFGLESISWSFDGREIVVVCGDSSSGFENESQQVCFFSAEDGVLLDCWTTKLGFQIQLASFSPVNNNILIAAHDGSGIYLSDRFGKDIQFLHKGTSPEWNSSGDQIAFIEDDQIFAIDISGTQIRLLFDNPIVRDDFHNFLSDSEDQKNQIRLYYLSGYGLKRGDKITWSNDMRYIGFHGKFGAESTFELFLYDTWNDEISCLSCYQPHPANIFEPDIQP